jgi:acyl carrier protein
MLFRVGPDRLRVEGFLLSCRALGRGVEHRMLAALGSLATRRGLAEIDLPLTDTGRNAPARAFLEAVATAGGAVFTVSAPAAARVVHRPAVAARPRTSTVPVRTDSPVPYARIAEELNDLDAIVAAIERSRFRHRPSLSTPAGAPDDELERELVAVWREVLAIDEVGIDDNFFELGGTSLRAVQLTGELTGRFGRPVPAIGMFEHPTVRAMSELLRGRENHGGGDDGRRRGLRRRARRSEG